MLLAGCGARNELADSGSVTGVGGATDASSSAAPSSSSSAGGGPGACGSLLVLDPITSLPTPGAALVDPQIAPLSDGGVLVSGLEPSGASASLRAARATPFDAWPPTAASDAVTLAPQASRFVLGPGVSGPVAYYNDDAGNLNLLMQTYPSPSAVALGTGGIDPLFVAEAPGRFLTGAATPTPAYEVLDVGSYEPSSLPQKEKPLVCITSPQRGSAIRSGSGFLAAFLSPNPPEPSCDVMAPKDGTVLVVGRYDPAASPNLAYTEGHLSVGPEPYFHALLAPRGEGAWLLEQTDGSTSRVPGPLLVRQLDHAGIEPPLGLPALAIDTGQLGEVAIAAIGDELAVAWIDSLDPSAPTVVVQIVRADLSLGPAASFSTSAAWFFGSLGLVASADGTKLFLAWNASGGGAPTVGVARVDCIPP